VISSGYQTGNSGVLRDYACDGWFSGSALFLNVSASTNHWVSRGEGTCITRFNGSMVVKGLFIQVNKDMGMVVNGPGIRGTYLRNI